VDEEETSQNTRFVDINGLRNSSIWPLGRKPGISTLRDWTRFRKIPHHKIGRLVLYDIQEVEEHIRRKCRVRPR
jgi:hypothetical protein